MESARGTLQLEANAPVRSLLLTDASDAATERGDPSWATIPTELLLAELRRRQDDGDGQQKPECGSRERGWYDTAAHVFALFLILFLSTVCMSIASLLEY